jgi:chromate reductase
MRTYRTAILVGSLRQASINRKLARAIVKLGHPSLHFHFVDLAELPMYNGDLEGQRPAAGDAVTAEINSADAGLMVMPEYNRSLPAVLKNAIDWGSKPMDKNVWRDKPIAMAGASPGVIGTAVGQQHLRQIMGVLTASVVGGECYIPAFKPELIDDDDNIQVEATRDFLRAYLDRFAAFVVKLAPQ